MDISYKEVHAMNREEARRRIIDTYLSTRSLSETARFWHTSRQVVRKWVRRFNEDGGDGIKDRSRKPRSSVRQTPGDVEQKVVEAKKKTGYGRKRLAWYLWREEGIIMSPHTIRHILSRHGSKGKRKPRKVFYPAHWAWEVDRPFPLAQVDTKDILDKGTLGTKRWTHIWRKRLLRYQWTYLDGRTRLRFLAFSRE